MRRLKSHAARFAQRLIDTKTAHQDKAEQAPFRDAHANDRILPDDFRTIAVARKHGCQHLGKWKDFNHIAEAGAAGRYLISRKMLQVDLADCEPAAAESECRTEKAINHFAGSCGVVGKCQQGCQAGEGKKYALRHAKRTGLQAHDVFHIHGDAQQGQAEQKDVQINQSCPQQGVFKYCHCNFLLKMKNQGILNQTDGKRYA